jgi:hypothetical protein
LKRRQNGLGVAGDFDAAEDAGEAAVFVDDEGGAFDAEDFFAVHGFFLEDAVEAADGAVGVAEERVRQGVFGGEFFVGGEAVAADAEDKGAGGGELGVEVAKLASFVRSAGCVVFGIEEEDDFLAAVGAEAYFPAAGGGEGEVGGWCADGEFVHYATFFRYFFPLCLV